MSNQCEPSQELEVALEPERPIFPTQTTLPINLNNRPSHISKPNNQCSANPPSPLHIHAQTNNPPGKLENPHNLRKYYKPNI